MIITKTVVRRGKEVKVSDLGKHSNYKISVRCPNCGVVRCVYYKSIVKAGHCVCQRCMMGKVAGKDLKKGSRYGMLVVIKKASANGYSLCLCDCGKIREFENWNLTSGKTRSCGCLKKTNFINAKISKGEKHGNWKGGISGQRQRMASTKIYKTWRTSIYEKDEYACQKCGQVGYELNVHHIESYAEHENKRCDITNGITLCKGCHTKFHKIYGRKNINRTQLNEFLCDD